MIDKFALRSRQEGYLARSVYKLLSLNRKYRIIKKGDRVLDLGCYPGSWLQVITELQADAYGIDIKQIFGLPKVKFILGDITDKNIINKIKSFGKFDVVLSDLSPKVTGIKHLDEERSFDLSLTALNTAKEVLKPRGNFVCKIFQSNSFNEFLNLSKKSFSFVKSVKPEASKKASKEMYVVALGYKT
ncbi:MAG: RlmE family RNA methyltransferase [Nanoarchaeota archaeon]